MPLLGTFLTFKFYFEVPLYDLHSVLLPRLYERFVLLSDSAH